MSSLWMMQDNRGHLDLAWDRFWLLAGSHLCLCCVGRTLVMEAWQLGGDMPWTKILGKTKAYKKGEFHMQQSSNDG
jgi:hypothetical protein